MALVDVCEKLAIPEANGERKIGFNWDSSLIPDSLLLVVLLSSLPQNLQQKSWVRKQFIWACLLLLSGLDTKGSLSNPMLQRQQIALFVVDLSSLIYHAILLSF
ncbi:hypothetical protein RIF29_20134 [Crotalaria pallida]|uniref:Uncharacterized protein n=1 Tax=Crotalaria pallida TaxID=3830 RepID=A0AAN9I8D5_CROPI